ncbi:MAG: molybdopterin molybdenumtransferase MoeA, partial [Pelodictyon phaeoclathratiforme]
VCFVEYCIPAICALAGKSAPEKFRATLEEPFPSDKKRHRFLLGRVRAEEGRLWCRISPKVESHMITSVVGSNCLIEAEPSFETLADGTEVLCAMLPWSDL